MDLGLPTKRVVQALACGGAHLNTTVRVRLRAAAQFASPQELGITSAKVINNAGSTEVERITITVVAGLSDQWFRRVFAHELADAMLLERNMTGLPDYLAEGMAEYFSWAYLTRSGAPEAERAHAVGIAANPTRCTAAGSVEFAQPSSATALSASSPGCTATDWPQSTWPDRDRAADVYA